MDTKEVISIAEKLNLIERGFRIFVISFGTLGIVYMAGRMTELVKHYRSKNILAVISLFVLSYCITIIRFPNLRLSDNVWDTCIYALFSAIVYVTVCWRLFDRADSLLDRKFGRDRGKPKK